MRFVDIISASLRILLPAACVLVISCTTTDTDFGNDAIDTLQDTVTGNDKALPDITDAVDTAADNDLTVSDETADHDSAAEDENDSVDADQIDIDTVDEDKIPPYDPRIEPALCGMKPYHWLPATGMGNIVEVDQMFGSIGDIAQTSKVALTIIKSQVKSDVNLQRDPQYDTLVYRILYKTQDKGQPVEATGLVALPLSGQTFPVLMVLHGTEGLGDPCAPSAGDTLSGTAAVAALLASFGYIVAVPDYIGLKSMGAPSTKLHSYLVGEPTAIASLDMLRAIPKFLERPELQLFGINVDAGKNIIMGGSQGGHAAAFTTRYAPYYAPELEIKGAAWGIPPTDMYRHAKRALNEYVPASGNTALVFLSADDWYRDDPSLLSQVFIAPWDTTLRPHALTSCDLGGPLDEAGVDTLEELFTPELLAAADLDPFMDGYEPWLCYVKENTLSRNSVPRIDNIPAFMILAENDQLVNPEIERIAFGELCDSGYKIQYRECTGAEHGAGFGWSIDDQLDWLDARYKDEAMTDVCTIHPPVKCKSSP